MDKLTHSGLYGIDETTKTIENLFGIDINYYARVNFTSLQTIVDALGGITVDSPYAFTSYHGNFWFNKGINEMDGYKALCFVRERFSLPKEEALKLMKGQPYKQELIEELPEGEVISFYKQGEFTDLCRGPHLPSTGLIKAFKLTSITGAYWRGDQTRKQLTRLYGISFPKKKMLDEYLELMEEAKKRDHRKIGKELELFTFSEPVGKGLPLWLPKGTALRLRLEDFLKQIQKRFGYQQVMTPHIGQKELWVTSGHYAKYGQDSFQPIHTPEEGEEYFDSLFIDFEKIICYYY